MAPSRWFTRGEGDQVSLQELARFNIFVRVGDGAVVVNLDGEFDMSEVEAFRSCMEGVIASCDGAVIVDLADVTFIDSSAISALLHTRRCLAGEGREFRLQHLTASVSRIFELAGLTGTFGGTGM
jgi:anti-sigma B factor antagonist